MPLFLQAEGPGAIRVRKAGAIDPIEVDDRLTIGRGEQNDLVLDDERMTISSAHCTIERMDHGYALIDHSRNGTFINQDERAVLPNRPTALVTGDVIRVGGFTLRISGIDGPLPPSEPAGGSADLLDAVPMAPLARPAVVPDAPDRSGRAPVQPDPAPIWPLERSEEQTLFPRFPARTPVGRRPADTSFGRFGIGAATPDHAPPEAGVFIEPVRGRPRIPDDWDLLADVDAPPAGGEDDQSAPSPVPPPASETAPPIPEASSPPEPRSRCDPARLAVATLLKACGLTPDDVPDARLAEVMGRMARILWTVVANLEDILAARSMTKQELGVERTMIGRSDNNIFKFAMGPKVAMRFLLVDNVAGFLPAERAIEQAFDDLKAHQVSLVAATQETLETMLRRLAPTAVNGDGPSGWLAGAIPVLAKARAWDRYVALHDRLAGDLANGDLGIPAEIFARAFSAPAATPPEDGDARDESDERAESHDR